MKVELKRIDDDFHLTGKGSTETEIDIDASEAVGGHSLGARPMELVLMGLGGCSGIDVISILKKQRQEIKSFAIVIEAEREQHKIPAVFKTIHVTFKLSGRLEENKVKRAVDLSMKKYCSITAMLEKTTEISYSFEIDG
jgi:putative redox protein